MCLSRSGSKSRVRFQCDLGKTLTENESEPGPHIMEPVEGEGLSRASSFCPLEKDMTGAIGAD